MGCLGACGLFLLAFVLAFRATSATERFAAEPFFLASLVGILAGLLGMILHLRLASRLTANEKQIWSARLWWLGPLVAGWYLLKVAGSQPMLESDKPNQRESA